MIRSGLYREGDLSDSTLTTLATLSSILDSAFLSDTVNTKTLGGPAEPLVFGPQTRRWIDKHSSD